MQLYREKKKKKIDDTKTLHCLFRTYFQEILLLILGGGGDWSTFQKHHYRLLRKAAELEQGSPKVHVFFCSWYSNSWFIAKPTNFSHTLLTMLEHSKQGRSNKIQRMGHVTPSHHTGKKINIWLLPQILQYFRATCHHTVSCAESPHM